MNAVFVGNLELVIKGPSQICRATGEAHQIFLFLLLQLTVFVGVFGVLHLAELVPPLRPIFMVVDASTLFGRFGSPPSYNITTNHTFERK